MKKKIFMLIVITMIMMSVVQPVFAKDLCTGLSGLDIDEKIPKTVHTIILIIQVAVPVLLVVFGMMDLVKAVMGQKEDEIKKGQQTLVKRIVAAAIVFFVFVVVKLVIGLVADSSDIMGCAECFVNGPSSAGCK